jgi:hypothetical protein
MVFLLIPALFTAIHCRLSRAFFSCPWLIGYVRLVTVSLIAFLVLLTLAVLPFRASAWNIPGHMLSGVIAYQVLQRENAQTIEKVNAVLEKHPWYANQWQARLQDVSVADHGLVLFMQAARWADDIRIRDKQHNRGAMKSVCG